MKKYKLLYAPTAVKDIQKLDGSAKKMILGGIERLSDNPEIGKPLQKDLKGLYSYRVASYRIIYQLKQTELIIVIIAVGHRKNIYDRLKRALFSNL